MVYRVIFRISYCEAYFDFCNAENAVSFATDLLRHQVPSEDKPERMSSISLKIIDEEDEKENEE